MKTEGETGQTEIKLVRKNTAAALIVSGRRAETNRNKSGRKLQTTGNVGSSPLYSFVAERPGLQ